MFKTGTTSLGLAFEELGYRTFHGPFWDIGNDPFDFDESEFRQNIEKLQPILDSYDAFEDYPFMFGYRYFAERYPTAKFVLTERDAHAVAESDRGMWRNGGVPEHEIPPNDAFVDRYLEHNRAVKAFFATMPERLLVVEVGSAKDFDALYRWCGRVPDESAGWPEANIGVHRRDFVSRIVHRAKRKVRRKPTVIRGPGQK